MLNQCAKILNPSYIVTYGCEMSIEFGNLDCVCKYVHYPIYFSYSQFANIYCLSLFVVFFFRLSRICIDYFNKLILFEKTRPDRTLFILCSNRTALFDYILTFEIGCPTASFDFETSCIDFELQSPDNRAVTQGRILSRYLFQRERVSNLQTVVPH